MVTSAGVALNGQETTTMQVRWQVMEVAREEHE